VGGEHALAEAFRRKAIGTGVAVGALAAAGLAVLRQDAPVLFDELTAVPAAPLVLLSAVAGVLSLALLVRRRYVLVRLTAALAVAAVVWGWGAAQYPVLLAPGLTVDDAAASRAVLQATLGALAVGAVLLVPSLAWLFAILQGERRA
jgi:cytochrome d ubiquinol oxidase subunit II